MHKYKNIYDLEERTAIFGENIIDLCKNTAKNVITLPIVDQIIRSGTSIGANYCEANGASSRKDFRNKIFICKKESKETGFWLRMLAKATEGHNDSCLRLTNEVQEFVLIFGKIAKNSE